MSGMSDFHLICSCRKGRFLATGETEDTEKTDPTPLPRRSRVPATEENRAYIQRRDSIIAWSVILSAHGANPNVEVMLLISPFLR